MRAAPGTIDPLGFLRSAGRRVTDPVEALAQQIAERVIDFIVTALDVNAVLSRVDLNALLEQVDLDRVLARLDINALLQRADVNQVIQRVDVDAALDRVDINGVAARIDMDQLVEHTDLGALIARSSGGVASEALDSARSQAVGLDEFIDHWVARLIRRKTPAPPAPPDLADAQPAPADVRASP
jgi:hypothetical protein